MTTYFYFHSPPPKLQLHHTALTILLCSKTGTFHLDVMIQKRSANTSDSYKAKIPPTFTMMEWPAAGKTHCATEIPHSRFQPAIKTRPKPTWD